MFDTLGSVFMVVIGVVVGIPTIAILAYIIGKFFTAGCLRAWRNREEVPGSKPKEKQNE